MANRLTRLGMLDVMPSTLNQRCTVFLATDLTQYPHQRELEEQDMQSAWFHRSDVERMIIDGTITDAKRRPSPLFALFLVGGQSSIV